LHDAEIALTKGQAVPLVYNQIGVTKQMYYRWRKEYGGLKVEQAKKLRGAGEGKCSPKKIGDGHGLG
jgi:putative transposase